MNRTHAEHAGYAVLMQAALFLASGNWWLGAVGGAFFFLGREHAQAEARAFGKEKRPEFGAFKRKYWDTDSLLDWIVPAVICIAIAYTLS